INYIFVFPGVFGEDVVTVMEGDTVTLHTDINKKEHDKMLWYFEDTRIALINGHPNTSCLYDGEGGRFRGRLEVDYKTGSLIITNITTEHAGRYEAEIIRSESSGKSQSLNRNRKCDSRKITKKISISHDDTMKTFNMIVIESSDPPEPSVLGMEGDPVTLNTDVPKQHHETMRWYFNDIQIAQINGHANTSCLYDGEGGRFRDRLKVDYETGSLNITNITTEHAGRYEAEIIRSESSGKRQSLNRNRKCDSTKTTKKNSNPEDIIITISLTVSVILRPVCLFLYRELDGATRNEKVFSGVSAIEAAQL
uniref:Immunoglobulin domain-containing protein n=1 Tax=Sinocyclocheilus grahami TaxID=75366 RepID=A0A672LB75_SINGR